MESIEHPQVPGENVSPPANRARRKWQVAWRVVRLLLIAYLVVLMAALFLEQRLIFFPSRYPDGDWSEAGDDIEDIFFESEDGVRLHGWYLPTAPARAAVLFFHGNAGNVSHRLDMLRHLRSTQRVTVFAIDYRGYGKSQGRPTEAGIRRDARAALDWLAKQENISKRQVVLMGRSLGGAVAVDLAAQYGARGLVLESTFSSLPDVAAYHYPWLPVRLLMRTRFDSLAKIGRYQGPLLQSHSPQDEIVPYRSGRELFEASTSRPKVFFDIPNGSHNMPQPPTYDRAVDQFLSGI